jgi:succinoglycan biosynthesis transport protein ExoP
MNIIRADGQSVWSAAAPTEARPFHWVAYLLSFCRRRWPTMVAGVVLAVALALTYTLTATPKFTAESDLLIDIRRADMLSQQHEIQDSQTLNAVLESEVEILRSQGLARKVVQELQLLTDPLFNKPEFSAVSWLRDKMAAWTPEPTAQSHKDPVDIAAVRLMQMAAVRRIGQTYVIKIGVKATDPVEAARLANGIVSAYVATQMESKDDAIREASAWLQQRLRQLRDQATTAGAAVEQYKAEKNIIGTDKGLMNEQQLTELNTALSTAHEKTWEAKAKFDRIEAIVNGGDVGQATVAEGLQNSVIVALRQKYLDDQQRAAEWAAKYGPDHIAVQRLREEMSDIEKSIRNELARIGETYRSDYQIAQADEEAMAARLAALVRQTIQTNGDRVVLTALQSSASTYRTVYENFLTRYTQAVQDESFPVSEARVITAAVPPLRKSEPQTTILAAISAVLGLCLGGTVAFAREVLDKRVRTADQVRVATGLPCLGLLPAVRSQRDQRPARPSAVDGGLERAISLRAKMLRHVVLQPRSRFAEPLSVLRMRLARDDHRHRNVKAIGFVTATRGEGGTTVAANFAQSQARLGFRTVLIDWNTANSALSRALAPGAGRGFLDLLSGGADVADVVCVDPDTGMRFIPAGWHPSMAIGTSVSINRVRAVLDHLRADHDFVVIDLPALTPAVEAHAAAHLLDAFVLVVGWGEAREDALVESLLVAELDETKFIGVLLNKVNFKAMRRYPARASGLAAGAYA